jgi:lipopolysaccharide biosynthesis glycosyltransferase
LSITKEQFAVVVCTDEKMLPAACCALLSAFENSRTARPRLMLVGLNLSPLEKTNAIEFFEQRGATLELFEFAVPQNFEKPGAKWPASTWARCFLDEILPQNLSRVVYLDADTLVLGDINDLFTMDLKANAIAAVHDAVMSNPTKLITRQELIGMDIGKPYFNAGMIIFNYPLALELRIMSRVRETALSGKTLYAQDQDAFNTVLNGAWLSLPQRYNVQRSLLPFVPHRTIAHFTGREKPWRQNRAWTVRFAVPRYMNYLKTSPWPDFCLPSSFYDTIKLFGRYVLRRLKQRKKNARLKSYFGQ